MTQQADPPNFQLAAEQRAVLEAIWRETCSSRALVDAPSFRADHEACIPLLDELCRLRYLQRDQDHYRLTILGLYEIDDVDSRTVLDLGSRLLDLFYKHYKDPRSRPKPLLVEDLARTLRMDRHNFDFVLTTLLDLIYVVSRGMSNFGREDASITISEEVLHCKNVIDVVNRVAEWRNRAFAPRGTFETSVLSTTVLHEPARSVFSADLLEALPKGWQQLLSEIQIALANDMTCLAVMGLRAIIDDFATLEVGDAGNFKKKITLMAEKSVLNSRQEAILNAAIEVGHAATHRMHVPTKEQCAQVLNIVAHLLREAFLLHPNSKSLKDSVPQRKRKSSDHTSS